MVNYMMCRLCGFIVKGTVPPKVCPVCGAPLTAFVPIKRNVEEKRLKFLEMDLHPISTHFSIGGAVFLVALFLVNLLSPTHSLVILGINLGYGGVLDFFVILEPIFVALTFVLGLFDGKMRYKKLQTPWLRYKTYLGAFAIVAAVLVLVFHFTSGAGSIVSLLALEGVGIFVLIGLGTILGLLGGKMVCPIVPRPSEMPPVKSTPQQETKEKEST